MIAAYIRVSTKQQGHESQKDAIARAVAARGEAIDTWFEETVQGHLYKRPELDRLRACARRGEFSKVYIFRLDRLSRAGIADTLKIVTELRDHGCPVVSLNDPIEFSGPMGELAIVVLAWAAQMERRGLQDRLEAARDKTIARGGTWGRPRTLKADTLRLALKAIAEGSSVRAAARELDISHSTLHRALQKSGKIPSKLANGKKTA